MDAHMLFKRRNIMKKKREWRRLLPLAALMFCCAIGWGMFSASVSAHQAGETVMGGWNRVAGTYNDKGQIVMNVCTEDYKTKGGDVIRYAHVNSNALSALCSGNEKKTIVIPSGSTVELINGIHPGSNTTIIADGATLVMNEKGKGILASRPTATGYKSIQNVRIQGGTWKLTDEEGSCSVIRFSHGSNVVIDGVTIVSNYESHAIELIAMKNTTVQNSTLKVQGKANKNSLEEALQIDIATPKTAPPLVQYGAKYVKGQTCKNIKILNNTIEGSRGLCVNFDGGDGRKYVNKFHDKITIIGNTMTGYSAEGCVIYNTLNAVVKNNTITSHSTRKTKSYSVGLNITVQGKAAKKQMKKAKIAVTNNTIYGVRQGMQLVSLTSSKYNKVTVKNNKCYAPKKKNAIMLSKKAGKKIVNKKNKMYKR